MKQHIINVNLNISKDTPAETLTELYAILKPLKMQAEKEKTTCNPLYALNEDIEKLHARYEELFKQVRTSLSLSTPQIELEEETLSRKYEFELEELSKRRKLEYDKQQAEIEARADEQTPWRRGWWWRLIFQPLTNRAQDIIEERAKLEADLIHTAEESAIEEERKKLPPVDEQETFICRLKRKLKAIFKRNGTDDNETSAEPSAVTQEQENAAIVQEPVTEQEPVQEPPEPPTRKPRKDKKSEG